MSRTALREMMRPLPWTLREEVEEYVRAVSDLAPAVFEEAEVQLTSRLYDDFIFLAGVRKLWHIVDAQYVLLDGSLSLVQEHGVDSLRVGRTAYSRGSEIYQTLRRLRNELHGQLVRLQIYAAVNTRSLSDLVLHISESSERR